MTTNLLAVRARTVAPNLPVPAQPMTPIPIQVTQTWGSRVAVALFWALVPTAAVLAVIVIAASLASTR